MSEEQKAMLNDSHIQRSKFEQAAHNAVLVVVLTAAFILLFGIAFPPPAPDVKAADWGAAIVARSKEAVPVLMVLLGTLMGWLGMSLTRGAHDVGLDKDGG